MNKVFCVSCGFKILYELKKPKFCSNCGESIAGGVSTASEKVEIEESVDLDVDLNKLKKDIVVESSKSASVNLGEIWASAKQGGVSSDNYKRPESKDPEGKELLNKTIQDCSSSRMRDVDEQ